MAPPTAAPAAPRLEAPEPTHPCIRCGRPGVAAENALCETCNPLELAQPSATQVHGIAALGILVFVAILAVAARWSLAGTGPFAASVTGVAVASGGLSITLTVENQGTKTAATTCRVIDHGHPTGGLGELVPTPQIAGHSSATFSFLATKLGAEPIPLDADCQSP
jgi:hypothetical protein